MRVASGTYGEEMPAPRADVDVAQARRTVHGVQRCRAGERRSTRSPIARAKRRGLLRNVAGALNDEEPLVRGHAAWALGRIRTEAARHALAGRAEVEADAWVREEIASALK